MYEFNNINNIDNYNSKCDDKDILYPTLSFDIIDSIKYEHQYNNREKYFSNKNLKYFNGEKNITNKEILQEKKRKRFKKKREEENVIFKFKQERESENKETNISLILNFSSNSSFINNVNKQIFKTNKKGKYHILKREEKKK